MIGDRIGAGTVFARPRGLLMLVVLFLGGAVLLKHDAANFGHPRIGQIGTPRGALSYAHLPLSFEPNQGQSDARVKFQARGSGYGLYLTENEAALALPPLSHGDNASVVEMQFAGGNLNPEVSGSEPLPGHSNYFIGNDPSRWHHNIPQFARVRYSSVYPGIDLVFYGKQGRLEYDFDVAPGADPRQIAVNVKGARAIKLAQNGDLVLGLDGREVRFEAPRVYQELAGGIRPVSGAFELHGDSVGFAVGEYDRTRNLVIDPVLTYSTYLGGSGSESCAAIAGAAFVPHCPAIAVDSAAHAYIAGATTSSGTFAGSTPGVIGVVGTADVFVARLNSIGSALDYVTYIGGSGTQYPAGVGVDSGLNVYVAGTTTSTDFPTTTANAFQPAASSAPNQVFFSKLDSSGSVNLYTTYLSGSGAAPGDVASGLAVDTVGRAYLIGTTTSADFPIMPGAIQGSFLGTTNQSFFSKIDPTASGTNSLPYSTFIGGSTPSNGAVSGGAVAVDSSFNVYLAAGTTFTDMPIVNASQSSSKGGSDAWVARLNAPATNTQLYTPLYETYLGGSGNDIAYGIATDGSNAYVTGSTTSSDITIPTATTPFQASNGGGTDAFVAKFGLPSGSGTTQGSVPLNYFTYLGGSAADTGLAIVADSNQNARVTGFTDSGNFPQANSPVQGGFGGGRDAFFSRIVTTTTSTGTNTSSSSFLGGSGTDIGTSIAMDSAFNDYVTGETSSGNFPVANALQASSTGLPDAFVTKLGPTIGLTFACSGTGCPATNPTVNPSPVAVGAQVTFKYSIYNNGDPVTGVIFTDSLSPNSTFVSATGATCGTPSGGTVVCTLGTVNTSSTTATAATTVSIVVSAPATTSGQTTSISNSAVLSVAGTSFQIASPSQSATVNDFSVSVTPASATVTSGASAVYVVKVTPTGAGFPESVSLACGSGLPSGAACSFTNNPIPNMSNGPQSRNLQITTTARVTTPGALFREREWFYALWLPITGLAVMGGGISRKRRWLFGIFLVAVLGTMLLEAGCGSSKKNTTTITGTPAGTYTVTINGTTGSSTPRTTTVQLTVQ